MFFSGALWARVKAHWPWLSFGVFWWNKVRTYDVKNAESRHVWRTSDFSERRVIWEIFGCEGAADEVEDVSVEDALSF
jgi:hypothetical protein